MDKTDLENMSLYNKAYKTIETDTLLDVGLTEDKVLSDGRVKQIKPKGTLKQKVIITFSRKMMEYQRSICNGQIERSHHLVDSNKVTILKKGLVMSQDL